MQSLKPSDQKAWAASLRAGAARFAAQALATTKLDSIRRRARVEKARATMRALRARLGQ